MVLNRRRLRGDGPRQEMLQRRAGAQVSREHAGRERQEMSTGKCHDQRDASRGVHAGFAVRDEGAVHRLKTLDILVDDRRVRSLTIDWKVPSLLRNNFSEQATMLRTSRHLLKAIRTRASAHTRIYFTAL